MSTTHIFVISSFDDELAYISQMKAKPAKRRGKPQDHAAVTKSIKHTIKLKSPASKKSKILEKSHLRIAGEMTPPDHSCLILTQIFAKLEKASKSTEQVCASLSSQLSKTSILDMRFLQGNAAEVCIHFNICPHCYMKLHLISLLGIVWHFISFNR